MSTEQRGVLKILFLTRYADNGASSRCRSYQLIPGLEVAGISCSIRPLLATGYLEALYSRRRFKKYAVGVIGVLNRLMEIFRVGRYDAVVVEKECVPHVPYFLERLLLCGANHVVLDFDDAVWVSYERSSMLREKISRIMRRADAVVVGSRYLQEYARPNNPKTMLVPTVVDANRYAVRSHDSGPDERATVIGWIGTPVTAKFLSVIVEPLRHIAARRPIVLLLVGGGDRIEVPGVLTRRLAWSLASEVDSISQMDIGIMPLTNDPFSRGKCGYKLIQYMASGLPTIASDVGENRHIIVDGETGFLIREPGDWEIAIDKLCDSAELRRQMGEKGRQRVLERYNLSHAVSAYVKILKNFSN